MKRERDEAQKRRDELYKRIPRPFRDHHKSRFIGEHYEGRERAAKEELSRHQKELSALLKRKGKIADAVKSFHRKIALRKTKREAQVRGVCDQHRGALAKGAEIPEAKMKANYEAALELK